MSEPAANRVLVRKYGGSSLSTTERLLEVARDVRLAREEGYSMVVVVSAMGGTTDELATMARRTNPNPPRRELDMLLSVGERITMSLLSMALDREGCPAISFTGSQCGIITDGSHTDARILEVKGDRVREALDRGLTVVVAGFQGVSRDREITTLGRGGSDTTAVALAAALGAVRCEILKDVDGVMTADPAVVPEAELHEKLDWVQMQDIAGSGCGVVHVRAVEYAAARGVPLVVRSSFHDGPGTRVTGPPTVPSPGSGSPAPGPERYRPLTVHTAFPVARLRLCTADESGFRETRDRLLTLLDPCALVAEWLDSGDEFRWEALVHGQNGSATDIRTEFPALMVGENMTVVSFAGGRPDTWLAVQRDLAQRLVDLGQSGARFRAEGSTLHLILTGRQDPTVIRALHRHFLVE